MRSTKFVTPDLAKVFTQTTNIVAAPTSYLENKDYLNNREERAELMRTTMRPVDVRMSDYERRFAEGRTRSHDSPAQNSHNEEYMKALKRELEYERSRRKLLESGIKKIRASKDNKAN